MREAQKKKIKVLHPTGWLATRSARGCRPAGRPAGPGWLHISSKCIPYMLVFVTYVWKETKTYLARMLGLPLPIVSDLRRKLSEAFPIVSV